MSIISSNSLRANFKSGHSFSPFYPSEDIHPALLLSKFKCSLGQNISLAAAAHLCFIREKLFHSRFMCATLPAVFGKGREFF
jgi:hypothetical protein